MWGYGVRFWGSGFHEVVTTKIKSSNSWGDGSIDCGPAPTGVHSSLMHSSLLDLAFSIDLVAKKKSGPKGLIN